MRSHFRCLTEGEWRAEGLALFGANRAHWRWVCPSCGHVASATDWINVGAKDGHIAFICVGRFLPSNALQRDELARQTFRHAGGPCDYSGGGALQLNPVTVVMDDGSRVRVFEFDKRFARKEKP